MPNSLKCRLKGLVRKGLLSEKDLSRIYTDNDVVEELEKINAKIQDRFTEDCHYDYYTADSIVRFIWDRITELKGNKE